MAEGRQFRGGAGSPPVKTSERPPPSAEVGQGAAAAGHLLGVTANGADQVDQVQAQTIEGLFDIAQLAGLRLQLHFNAEVTGGPGRQRRHQAMQDIGQAPLDGVDGQGDQQHGA